MNIKVLLADDEEQFVEMLSQRLEAREFDVSTAFDGDQALKILQERDMDVVILDVVMPGKDGIETLREIKQMKPLTEVIMLTGHGTVESGIEGMKLGAYDYLMKPTDTGELVEKITKAYARKAGQEQRIKQAEINEIIKRRGW